MTFQAAPTNHSASFLSTQLRQQTHPYLNATRTPRQRTRNNPQRAEANQLATAARASTHSHATLALTYMKCVRRWQINSALTSRTKPYEFKCKNNTETLLRPFTCPFPHSPTRQLLRQRLRSAGNSGSGFGTPQPAAIRSSANILTNLLNHCGR